MEEKFFQPIEEDIRVIHNINSSNIMECPHFHNHYELHFTLSYNLKFIIANTIFYVPKGSVFAIKTFTPHMTVVPDDAWFERYTVHIRPEVLQEINRYTNIDFMELFQSSDGFPACHIKLKQEDIPVFEQVLNREKDSLKGSYYGDKTYQQVILSEILLYLLRVNHEGPQQKNEIYDDENGILAKKIMEYITDNITMDLNLELLEKTFYINKYSISRLFKEYCGVTVNQYITSRRIYLACELLKKNQPVFQVCEQSGFSDYGHFIRTFKKHVGISPKQYALHIREKETENIENI